MRISDKTYDTLKWMALVAIPALEALWLTVGKAWGFPYLTEIGTTIAAVGLFLATLIGVSSHTYYNDVDEEDEDDLDYDEDQEMLTADLDESYMEEVE